MNDELDEKLTDIFLQCFISNSEKRGKAIEKVKALIAAHDTAILIDELEKLESLPNVYPEKIENQYTHVEAIYKSAVIDRHASLRSQDTKRQGEVE